MLIRTVFLIALVLTLCNTHMTFEEFKARFNKHYNTIEEERAAEAIFNQNQAKNEQHNS